MNGPGRKVGAQVDGAFSARVYCVEGAPDADGDVVLGGALADGHRVTVSLGEHDALLADAEPAGEAELRRVGNAVHAFGTVFATARGEQLRAKLQARGRAQEWSIGFPTDAARFKSRPPTASELERWPDATRIITHWEPAEISPVTRGACGPACRTLGAKDAGACTCERDANADTNAVVRAALVTLGKAAAVLAESESTARAMDQHFIPAELVDNELGRVARFFVSRAAHDLGIPVPQVLFFMAKAADAPLALAQSRRHCIAVNLTWLSQGGNWKALPFLVAHEVRHLSVTDAAKALGGDKEFDADYYATRFVAQWGQVTGFEGMVL